MSVDTPAQAGVSIDALLAAKEQRAARQADWLAHYQQPVISLTLVTPGAVKDSIRYRNMMGVALQACDQLLWKHRWQTLDRQGRQSLGESQRRCLLCDEPAHACARSRRHDTDLVVARVEQMIDAWFARD